MSRAAKTMHVAELQTPPENDAVYGAVNAEDPDVRALARNIAEKGVLEPLVVTEDGYVLSGNRRLTAARLAGLDEVPVRVENVHRGEPEFMRLLVSYNTQRVKSLDQVARELAVTVDPATAHSRLIEARKGARPRCKQLDLGDARARSSIKGTRPLADAALKVIAALEKYLPLTDRQIHYQLLNDPPLLHAAKTGRYANSIKCYRALVNVLGRMRINGEIPWDAISDETRPVVIWPTFDSPNAYLRHALDKFLQGYWRNLLQSQPHHVEAVIEKMTLQSLLEPVAGEYTIPLTVARGFLSLPPRWGIVERFRKSGKDKLALVILSDLDPAGESIAESLGRSLRDDFGIDPDRLVPVKAALTIEQVRKMKLPARMEVKAKGKSQLAKAAVFINNFGVNVWELEAVAPAALQQIFRDALASVLDMKLLQAEREREQADAAHLAGYREGVLRFFDQGQ